MELLGWIIAMITIGTMMAAAMLRPPPREEEYGRYTIVFSDTSGKIHLMPAHMHSLDEAERILEEYGIAMTGSLNNYYINGTYNLIGVLDRPTKWVKDNDRQQRM